MTDPTTLVALVATVGLGLIAVLARDLLVSILSLAATSLALATYVFLAGAPVAAVFEAIVAAGLVTVLFLLVVSLTDADRVARVGGVKSGVVALATGVLLAIGATLWALVEPLAPDAGGTVPLGQSLWAARGIDLVTVSVLVFVGVLAVRRLAAERPPGDADESPEVDP